jgi:putative membrane protein insertion efficiency factor
LIDLYRWCLGPLLGTHCRFHPSCSAFAREAVLRHGTARGLRFAAGRLLRCHPFAPGGYDPVPEGRREGEPR